MGAGIRRKGGYKSLAGNSDIKRPKKKIPTCGDLLIVSWNDLRKTLQ